jgi:hypothetical protein
MQCKNIVASWQTGGSELNPKTEKRKKKNICSLLKLLILYFKMSIVSELNYWHEYIVIFKNTFKW